MTESYNCLYLEDEKVKVLFSVSIQKQKFHAFLLFSNHPVHSGEKKISRFEVYCNNCDKSMFVSCK